MKLTIKILIPALIIMASCFSKGKITEINYTLEDLKYQFDEGSDTLIINDEKELTNSDSTVDIDEKTILGFKGSIGGCEYPDIDIKVIRNDSKRKYTVEANITQKGFCKKLILYQKYITIDKVKENYHVIFQINNITEAKETKKPK